MHSLDKAGCLMESGIKAARKVYDVLKKKTLRDHWNKDKAELEAWFVFRGVIEWV